MTVSAAKPTAHGRQIRQYYDENTGRFLKWGRDEGTANIHAALWPAEVRSLAAAMQHANELVAREIGGCAYPVDRVLDLGCGVGAGLFYLGRRLPQLGSLVGVTLSPVQVERARQGIPANQTERFRFEKDCFLELSPERFHVDFAYAIEAFGHCGDPERFFRTQARLLPTGGRLVIIDDCLTDSAYAGSLTPDIERLLERYQRHWLLPGLLRPADMHAVAGASGFTLIKDRDLTPDLRIGRLRDKAIALMVRFCGVWMTRSSYLRSLLGGDAKQKCYREGLIRYRLLVFEKIAHPAAP
jgi:cyclopropane fatty-acyl-phospholipid synthase-like methyltransferase